MNRNIKNDRVWLRAILCSYAGLVLACDRIDSIISRVALQANCCQGSQAQADEICRLIYRKTRLVNLKVLVDRLSKSISPKYWFILNSRFIEGDTLKEIGLQVGAERQSIRRRLLRAVDSASALLREWGFDEDYFDREYIEEKKWMFDKLRSEECAMYQREISDAFIPEVEMLVGKSILMTPLKA